MFFLLLVLFDGVRQQSKALQKTNRVDEEVQDIVEIAVETQHQLQHPSLLAALSRTLNMISSVKEYQVTIT